MSRGSVLVTGARGFVGKSMVPALRAHGWTVVPTSRSGVEGAAGLDLADRDAVRALVKEVRPDAVVHLAGITYLPEVMAAPVVAFSANVLGTLNLLEAVAAEVPRARVLAVSSCTVYGAPESLPLSESAERRAVHPYGMQKVGGELLAERFRRAGLDCVILRPFNHLGPGQDVRISLNHFADEIARAERGEKEPVIQVGNLDARRDMLDVRDVVRAYAMVLEHPEPPAVLNVASGRSVRIGDALDHMLSKARVPCRVETSADRMRPLDVPDLVGDASLLRETCGWAPQIDLEETFERILGHARGERLEPW